MKLSVSIGSMRTLVKLICEKSISYLYHCVHNVVVPYVNNTGSVVTDNIFLRDNTFKNPSSCQDTFKHSRRRTKSTETRNEYFFDKTVCLASLFKQSCQLQLVTSIR